MKRSDETREQVLIVLARAGEHRLALRASEVDGVAEITSLTEPPLDVPRTLGVVSEPNDRAVRLCSGRWLALGSDLLLRTVESAAFTPLPLWLPARLHALPLASAVDLGDGFALEIDPALLELEEGAA